MVNQFDRERMLIGDAGVDLLSRQPLGFSWHLKSSGT